MTEYKCAIIGCGGRAKWHAQAYEQIVRGKLVACCDIDPERKKKFAKDNTNRIIAPHPQAIPSAVVPPLPTENKLAPRPAIRTIAPPNNARPGRSTAGQALQ